MPGASIATHRPRCAKKPVGKRAENDREDTSASAIRAVLYDAGGHDEDIDPAALPVKALREAQLLWIDGPLDQLRAFKHLPTDIANVLMYYTGICGLEILDPVYRITVPSPPDASGGKSLGFVVGKSWLVTVTEPRPTFADRFIDTDQGETLNGRMTPSALAVGGVHFVGKCSRSEITILLAAAAAQRQCRGHSCSAAQHRVLPPG